MKNIFQFTFLFSVMVLITGCLSTASNTLGSSQSGHKPSINEFEKRSWISYDSLELFQDEDFLYVSLPYASNVEGKFSLFNPPNGSSFMMKGDIKDGEGEIFERVDKDKLKRIEGVTMLFFPGDFSNESERTGLFFNSEEIKWSRIPTVDPERYTLREDEFEKEVNEPSNSNIEIKPFTGDQVEHDLKSTPQEFKASRTWILDTATVLENPEFNSSDIFSSRFMIHDIIDIPFISNDSYLGEWKPYWGLELGNYADKDLSGQFLYKKLLLESDKITGDTEDGVWRGILFEENGKVQVDSGNQIYGFRYAETFPGAIWTDGWLISEVWKTASHIFTYKDEQNEYLFLEIKNGDYFRGRSPLWGVFIK